MSSSNITSYNLHCPMVITEESGGENKTVPGRTTKNVLKVAKEISINLFCSYAIDAEYEWSLVSEGSHETKLPQNRGSLKFTVSKTEQRWQDFISKGLTFRCRAVATASPLENRDFMDVITVGIDSINHGKKKSFDCGTNSNQTFIWKVDGVREEEHNKSSANITFTTDRPKRVFVECANTNETVLARFSMIVCGLDELQQRMILIVMCLIPGLFVAFLVPTILLPIWHGKNLNSKTRYSVNSNPEKPQVEGPRITGLTDHKDNQHSHYNPITGLLIIQLILLPLFAGFSYITDVVTDYIAFFGFVLTDDAMHGLATLALIILSAIVTSTIASTYVFFDESRIFFDRLTKTPLRRALTFICMSCNFGPVLIQLQLFLTNIEIFKFFRAKMEVPFKLRYKQSQILRLLVKLAISELICESLGQGILQAYILSRQLGTEDICVPHKDFLKSNITKQDIQWENQTINKFQSFVTNKPKIKQLSFLYEQSKYCDCKLRIAKGAEHCYPETYLQNEFDNQILQEVQCHIAECTTNKYKFSVIYPIVQVISSILQVSFAMTHLGAFHNLGHIASMQVVFKKGFFYLFTFFFFLISLSVSLLLSTYFAYIYDKSVFQLMAFLSVLRLFLPESTPARKYVSPWLMRVLTILLPLIAHLPYYYLLYDSQEISCQVQARNRITIHMQNDQIFKRDIAAYLSTAPGVNATLENELRNMTLFPINLSDLTGDQTQYRLPNSTDDGIFNIRNRFNVFGTFFLWTGYLVVADISITAIFLLYWIFIVRAYHKAPSMNKLVDRMVSLDVGPVGFKEAQSREKTCHRMSSQIFAASE